MMMLEEYNTFYDLLELTPDASQQEIRQAYLKAKSAYKKDSVALYSLISEDETEQLLSRIEEAYQILSNPDRRRDYDRSHGFLTIEEELQTRARAPRSSQKIVSIDRVPPMESTGGDTSILVPPSTDFTGDSSMLPSGSSSIDPFAPNPAHAAQPAMPAANVGTPSISSNFDPPPSPHQTRIGQATSLGSVAGEGALDSALLQEIQQETEWKGTFLRKIRDARKVSVEEIADFTKISKSYILAVEEDNYSKLPAAVYLRGFVTQISKFLKLPHDKVASAYMARYNQAKSEKSR